MKSSAFRFGKEASPEVVVLHEVRQATLDKIEAPADAVTHRPPLPSINHQFDAPPAEPAAPQAATDGNPIRADLEGMPHILGKIQALWKSRDLNTFIAQLLLDSRDGSRAGFPLDVAKELMFLVRLNVLIRAEEVAPLLGIVRDEAIELIVRGDELALGHRSAAEDIWSLHVADTRPKSSPLPFGKPETAPGAHAATARLAVSPKLAEILSDAPPFPPAVRLDLTTPKLLHSARGPAENAAIMDRGFFRCIAKELSTLGTRQLVLSSLGESASCDWLPAAIRFAKMHCRFEQVVLHVDLLNTPESLLRFYIKEGLDHLVIFLNQASGTWRARAKATADATPDYFPAELRRLIAFRDEHAAHAGHRCRLSVATNTHRSAHALGHLFGTLNALPGIEPYAEVLLPRGVSNADAKDRGRCHCLAPFVEAHIRSNGHLVACAQDHSGFSFAADLKQTTFSDAWLGQVFRKTRQRVIHGEPAGRLCDICPHRGPALTH